MTQFYNLETIEPMIEIKLPKIERRKKWDVVKTSPEVAG